MKLVSILIGAAALANPAAGQAQQQAGARPANAGCAHPASSEVSDTVLLDALVKRRTEVVGITKGDNRPALKFLDIRIAEVKQRIATCARGA